MLATDMDDAAVWQRRLALAEAVEAPHRPRVEGRGSLEDLVRGVGEWRVRTIPCQSGLSRRVGLSATSRGDRQARNSSRSIAGGSSALRSRSAASSAASASHVACQSSSRMDVLPAANVRRSSWNADRRPSSRRIASPAPTLPCLAGLARAANKLLRRAGTSIEVFEGFASISGTLATITLRKTEPVPKRTEKRRRESSEPSDGGSDGSPCTPRVKASPLLAGSACPIRVCAAPSGCGCVTRCPNACCRCHPRDKWRVDTRLSPIELGRRWP